MEVTLVFETPAAYMDVDQLLNYRVLRTEQTTTSTKTQGMVGYLVAGNRLQAPKRVLKAVAVQQTPFVNIRTDGRNETKRDGLCVRLTAKLVQKAGYTYETYQSPKNEFGHLNEGGNWTGTIGEVYYGHADMTMGPVTISSQRLQVVDFTPPFMTTSVRMVFRRSRKRSPLLLFNIFPLGVVGGILGGIIGIGCVFYIIAFIRRLLNIGDENDNKFSCRDSIWMAIWIVLEKRDEPIAKSIAARMMLAGSWLCSRVVMLVFVANLTVLLTTHHEESDITSLEDLVNKNVKTCVVENEFIFLTLKSHSDAADGTVYDKLYQRILRSGSLVKSTEEGLSKAKKDNFIFLEESPVVEYAVLTDKDCDLVTTHHTFLEGGFGVATRLGDPLGKDLSIALKEMQEDGELDVLKQQWFPETKCDLYGEKDSSNVSTSVAVLTGAAIMLAVFALSSILEAIVEGVYKKIRERFRKPINLPQDIEMTGQETDDVPCEEVADRLEQFLEAIRKEAICLKENLAGNVLLTRKPSGELRHRRQRSSLFVIEDGPSPNPPDQLETVEEIEL